jgi:hypothetical protein
MKIALSIASLLLAWSTLTQAADIEDLLDGYRSAGASTFSAQRGAAIWSARHRIDGQERACSSCHTADPASPGKHAKTGKPIEPMAASVNPSRFTDAAKVAKWFRRNCKWTLGRECTPQEKGDLLTWLNTHQE